MDGGRSLSRPSMPSVQIGARTTSVSAGPNLALDLTEDRRAVDAVLAGDREAFRVLVERESASVIRACHRVLGDIHEAEDAAQEAFVTAFRSLAGWRGDGPFGAWLTRIAVRIALRRGQKRRDVVWIDPTHPEHPVDVPGGPDPAMTTLRAERSAGV